MTFQRSTNGIQNRAIFTRAHFTVFIETTKDNYERNPVDISFWRSFFEYFYGEMPVRFAPLGTKSAVEAMADKIIAENMSRTLCAMDRDYDDLYGKIRSDDRIFYTWGYGAENDLICDDVMNRAVSQLIATLDVENVHAKKILEYINETIVNHRMCFVADQLGKGRHSCVLDRQKPQSDIEDHKTALPVVLRKKVILGRLKPKPTDGSAENLLRRPEIARKRVPAHLMLEISYQTVRRYVYKRTKETLNKKAFLSLLCAVCVYKFRNLMPEQEQLYFAALGSRNLGRFH
ncbi:MAG: DUF4435 domain-containing protein [Microcystis aeruginosa Ma_OC_H_19870700_S124]|uniref:DUF4435 domain-containing protein n=1 Tax=Microcystis aeruginosa Ma_OC_H_19870700_S124 TaxID=2486262 RepID=A0A552AUP7_MICAE|nr:MAG: DUF4435 domain-containing protein [Microcystis aeruginosa Ma_OC_H_19870700_S124]